MRLSPRNHTIATATGNDITISRNFLRRLYPLTGFACQLGPDGRNPLAITPDRDSAHAALNQLLAAVAPKQAEQTAQVAEDVSARLDRCIDLTKAEAPQAASLIANCAPHGKPMLAQAQATLESLESLKMLEAVASEMFGA